jgi:hypothetical protein
MSHPVHLILSPGTRIVTRNDANRIGGQAVPAPNSAGARIPVGAVAVIIDSPADAQHAYKVRCNDGAEAMLRRNEFSILKEFKAMPERGCVADQPQRIGNVGVSAADASHTAALQNADFEDWEPFIIYRCVVGSQAFGLSDGNSDVDRRGIYLRLGEERDALLTIKRGERPWPDVNAWRLRLHEEFDEAFASTRLPERPDYNWANEFLLKARREMAADPSSRT